MRSWCRQWLCLRRARPCLLGMHAAYQEGPRDVSCRLECVPPPSVQWRHRELPPQNSAGPGLSARLTTAAPPPAFWDCTGPAAAGIRKATSTRAPAALTGQKRLRGVARHPDPMAADSNRQSSLHGAAPLRRWVLRGGRGKTRCSFTKLPATVSRLVWTCSTPPT